MKYCFLILFIFINTLTQAQTFKPGMKLATHLSYTGLYLDLTPSLQFKNYELAIGPKIALSETRIPTRGPVGLDASFTAYTGCDCRVKGFLTGNYQYIAFQPPYQFEDIGDRIRVHEIQAGFGMRWKATSRMGIYSAIYAGRYTEKWPGFYGRESVWQSGYNSMIRLGFSYLFVK